MASSQGNPEVVSRHLDQREVQAHWRPTLPRDGEHVPRTAASRTGTATSRPSPTPRSSGETRRGASATCGELEAQGQSPASIGVVSPWPPASTGPTALTQTSRTASRRRSPMPARGRAGSARRARARSPSQTRCHPLTPTVRPACHPVELPTKRRADTADRRGHVPAAVLRSTSPLTAETATTLRRRLPPPSRDATRTRAPHRPGT